MLEKNKEQLQNLEDRENIDALTETEAKAHLERLIASELARQQLDKKYYTALRDVLSAKKILKLMEADRSFRRKLIEEFKERHRGERPRKTKIVNTKKPHYKCNEAFSFLCL
ncbi:hypothetical protein N7U66_20035 [Lacinutrix neustonica]|uniref:Uncharacterized protein n=1 Tax=Lacinutrix neustonica TaxID=2980107 RepID=A0A9E8SDS2_9FLAO|nr:hypothetical protein [Lacinutrix neustonica]WAC02057.1 hypothetical protein N7U66_20035 [Lacinutrix neustonica]